MFYHAQEGLVQLSQGTIEYIRFGTGRRTLVMLPGLGDSLRSMKGTAIPMALMYRIFAREFTIYVFSRRKVLPTGYTTRDMARDQAEAMERLGISTADIFGVSMGGMIAQHLAIDYPQKVGKVILAVTAARPNPLLEASVREWMEFAQKGDHIGFMDSNLRRIYSETYCRKNRWMIPLLGKLTKPKSYDRFFIQANACLTHNTYASLNKILSPTLVVGGVRDQILGGDASREIADMITGAELFMYPQWGHGLYEESSDFNRLVLDYLCK